MKLLTTLLLLTTYLSSTAQGLHTETTYTDSTGITVTIQSSYPRGGAYLAPLGQRFFYTVFYNRIKNETDTPIEINIQFPADSFSIPALPNAYFKLFLPPSTMTAEKETQYDYGVTGIKSFLDTGLREPTTLQKTINPKEECVFNIGALFLVPANGPVRTALVVKDQNLFYKVSIDPLLDSALFPCGKIVLKKSGR